jgi:hypothetical protein
MGLTLRGWPEVKINAPNLAPNSTTLLTCTPNQILIWYVENQVISITWLSLPFSTFPHKPQLLKTPRRKLLPMAVAPLFCPCFLPFLFSQAMKQSSLSHTHKIPATSPFKLPFLVHDILRYWHPAMPALNGNLDNKNKYGTHRHDRMCPQGWSPNTHSKEVCHPVLDSQGTWLIHILWVLWEFSCNLP